jgi:Beta-propeller repeat
MRAVWSSRRRAEGLSLTGAALLALAGGCHLIVGIRDAEPYPPDAGAGAGGATACSPSQTQVCYGGPAQTEGVGVCKSGTQLCTAEGEWGACEGAVLPEAEDCSAPADEDCDGYVCGETLWVQQFGVQSTSASPTDVAVDRQTGDIYVAGSFSGVLPIGSDMLDSQGLPTVAFLAKFDPQGTPLWAKQFGGGGANTAQSTSVALDGQGNVVLIGTANPTVNLGDGDLPRGVFIGKFASSGQLLWSQACQTDESFILLASGAVDPISDDVVVAGSFYDPGTITCGNVSLTGAQDVFVSRLAASDGSVVFATSYGGDDGDGELYDVAVDGQGSILITGSGNNLSFGDAPLTGGYIAKLASNGSHVWSKGFGDGAARALAVDAVGALAMLGAGDDTGSLNFGSEDLMPLGEQDLFLATLNELGDHVSSRRFGSPGANQSNGLDVAIDSKGNLAVAGRVEGNVIIDNVILTGSANAFVVKFATDGKASWLKTFGREDCYVAFSSLDELVAACESYVAADFGLGLATPVGSSDLFLLKIAP